MTTNDLLKQGIAALKAGQKIKARRLLSQAVEQDKYNEQAWLWLSGAVDTDKERFDCLKNVLIINPSNMIAQQGIERLQSHSIGCKDKAAFQPIEEEDGFVRSDIVTSTSASEVTASSHESHPFTSLIEEMVRQLELPQQTLITPEAQTIFNKGMDRTNEYRGDPAVLWEALVIFQQTHSLPLFYIGVAYVHAAGSYKENITYSKDGLQAGQLWLQRAKELTPEAKELLIVQTYIDIHRKDYTTAQHHLTQLRTIAAHDFYVLAAHLYYYGVKQDIERMTAVYREALPLAMTITRRSYLLARVARYYLISGRFDKSLEVYRDLVKLTPTDPWMWHNMSFIYLIKKKLIPAWRCNRMALQLMDFENARIIQGKIHDIVIRGVISYALLIIFLLGLLWHYRDVIFK